MKLIDIILEAAEKHLYYTRSLDTAVKIVKDNMFVLNRINNDEFDASHGKFGYFMSFARTPANAFNYEKVDTRWVHGVVMFEIDGGKLGQRYKLTPTNYFRDTSRSIGSEAEERLVSTRGIIPNANKYIKAIHIMYDPDEAPAMEKIKKQVKDLVKAAQKYGIPIYDYKGNINAFKILRKSNAEDISKSPTLIDKLLKRGEPKKVKLSKQTLDQYDNLVLKMLSGDTITLKDIRGVGHKPLIDAWKKKDIDVFINILSTAPFKATVLKKLNRGLNPMKNKSVAKHFGKVKPFSPS